MKTTFVLVAAAGLFTAPAAMGTIVGDPLVLTATSSLGTAQYVVRLQDGTYNPSTGDFSFSSTSTVQLMDDSSGRLIGTLTGLSVGFIGDPQISIGFSVQSGAAPTSFTIASGLNAFASILNPAASGVASMTLTDNNSNGASLTGNVAPGFSYGARFNGTNTYLNRVNDLVAGPGQTVNDTGFLTGTVLGSVTDQSALYSFTLSAGDTASGTSVYTVVPAPGALLLLGGLALARRRR
jgi:MYXO-CTERM domain-containing protein